MLARVRRQLGPRSRPGAGPRIAPRTQVAGVAVALAATLTAATASAAVELTAGQGDGSAVEAVPERRAALLPSEGVQRPAPVPAQPFPVATPTAPAAVPPVVAPLGELQKPDLLVTVPASLTGEQLQGLQAVEGLAGLAVLDAGPVQLAGEPSRFVGVDPGEFRHFVPQDTAASDPLWAAVARGELASGSAVAEQRNLPLGGSVGVGAPEQQARVGAVASFGLPGVDVVVDRSTARGLGAVPDSVVVVSAPDVGIDTLRKRVRDVVGEAEVEVLRPAPVAASKIEGKPKDYRELYIDSARYCPGLSWTVLAAIGQVESGHGKNLGPSSAGALGPMQFLPSTWEDYGVDGDGDGIADIMNPFDAVPSSARYLCRFGAARDEQGLYDAVFAYNRADWYVRKVLGLAAQYQ